jgi:hypothetical protein
LNEFGFGEFWFGKFKLGEFGFNERPERVLGEGTSVVDGKLVTGGVTVAGARGVRRVPGGVVGIMRSGPPSELGPSTTLPRVTRDGKLFKFGKDGGWANGESLLP